MTDDTNQDDSYYRSRTRKMALTVISVSLAPMLLVSTIILYQFQRSYHEKILDHLEELVEKHKQNIDSFLDARLADIRMLASARTFEELSDEAFLNARLALLQDQYGPVFVDLGVINAQGIQVAYAGPFKLGRANYASAEWFQKTMNSQYFISDVFLGLRNLPHFIVAVRGEGKGEPWIMRATIDFVAFNHLVENIRIGRTGFAFIVNRKGEFQTKPLQDILPGREPYRDLLKNSEGGEDRIQVFERRDESGKKNLYVAGYLKGGEWVLICQQKASDAFSDLRNAQRVTLLIILIGGLGVVTTAQIISRRMFRRIARVDKEKELMNEQMVETGKLASLGELAAGIAHEINNPVAIMVEEAGWIEDLLADSAGASGDTAAEITRAVKQIRTQGERCKAITHKLLSFARKTDPTARPLDINQLVEEVVGLMGQKTRYANVKIELLLSPGLPAVYASPSELQQVLLNLVNNAIDAIGHEGGAVTVSTGLDDDGMVALRVVDTGEGIPEANLERIFDPFFTTKPVGQGTGLGLSICYGIIDKLGGRIAVESEVGVGTTFSVRLPAGRPSEDTGAPGEETA
jgi:two-component system, NtrC family, sensor kinase